MDNGDTGVQNGKWFEQSQMASKFYGWDFWLLPCSVGQFCSALQGEEILILLAG